MIRTNAILAAVGLLAAVAGVTAAATGTDVPAALGHASDKARDMASGHSLFHRHAGDSDSSDRRCDEFQNHGEYVSGVAHEDRDDNESGREHGETVRAAAQSDIGKCPHEERGEHNETDDDNETADHGPHGDDNETDEGNETGNETGRGHEGSHGAQGQDRCEEHAHDDEACDR